MAEFTLPNAEQAERLIAAIGKGNETRTPDDPYGSPGPQYIERGNKQAGFYGFVKPSEFGIIPDGENGMDFNGSNLAQAIGLSAGTLMESNTPWMKFSWNGKILFVPLKPIRRSLSWDSIYQAGAVYGTGSGDPSDAESYMLENDSRYVASEDRVSQDASVTVGNLSYTVRLMRGAASDPQDSYYDSDRGSNGPENEWNHLIPPLHERAPNSFRYNTHAGSPTADWDIGLTDFDLRTHHTLGVGSYTWCQEFSDYIDTNEETGEEETRRRVFRGYYGASYLYAYRSSFVNNYRGWRPVLELS